MSLLPDNIKKFIEETKWTFAKTYAKTWPHEYIVREEVDENLFDEFATFIDSNGYTDYFYQKKMIYLDYQDQTYWHMENIINRCPYRDTYRQRKAEGRLPDY